MISFFVEKQNLCFCCCQKKQSCFWLFSIVYQTFLSLSISVCHKMFSNNSSFPMFLAPPLRYKFNASNIPEIIFSPMSLSFSIFSETNLRLNLLRKSPPCREGIQSNKPKLKIIFRFKFRLNKQTLFLCGIH